MKCSFFCFAAKGYLDKLEEDPAAVVLLGDSAYKFSSLKEELGLGVPVPQRKDGVQQTVRFSHLRRPLTDIDEPAGRRSDAESQVAINSGHCGADYRRCEAVESHGVEQDSDRA